MNIYKALALQTTCHAINKAKSRKEAFEMMKDSIAGIGKQIRASKAFIGPDTQLVVLPEYFLSSFPLGESMSEWQDKACLEMDGPIYELLGELAVDNKVFLSGNAYELDPNFPELYFQCSFIIDKEGKICLRYRRLNSMFAPTPHDVWDKYLEVYGLEAVFPVAKTEIGNLACIASEEILYPEIARCLMMRGAEIFLHSSSEVASPQLTQKNVAKLARAIENMAYVISANSAGIADIAIPFASTDRGSKVVNYEGLILAEASSGESMTANATIDLHALRHHRRRVGMSNFIARQRFELYAGSYGKHQFYPINSFADQKVDRKVFISQQVQTIQKLSEAGII